MPKQHLCPWWMGYLLLSPLRKLAQNPHAMLKPYIKPGMTVIDYGCAMGFFSLPMARLAGPCGAVHCFDIQQKMLDSLTARAKKAGLAAAIKPHLVNPQQPAMPALESDFALLFAVAHEAADQPALFNQLYTALKPGALLLFAEPPGHVSQAAFEQSLAHAQKAGFIIENRPLINKSRSALLKKAN